MEIQHIIKRDYTTKPFHLDKITGAIEKAMIAVGVGDQQNAEDVALSVYKKLIERKNQVQDYVPTIEEVQDIVETQLMESKFKEVAKAYILYRNKRTQKRQTDIFEKRINLKPYEYPHLYEYVPAIRHSYWIHSEFNFTSDIQDFKSRLSDCERSAIKNTMLAISQIEVAVKSFWGDLYHRIPKPEIGSVGSTFAESEVRHADAYSHLLEILGLNSEFKELKKKPAIMKRVRYLETALKNSKSDDNREYAEAILLFSLFIEHVSLFSQFLIIMAFNKHKNMLKGISNVVEATSKEEQIHGDFGIDLIKILQKENPDWFTKEYHKNMLKGISNVVEATSKEEQIHGDFGIDLIKILQKENPDWFTKNYHESIQQMCKDAFEAESEVVDWIFENGELDFLPKAVVNEFLKNRFNNSLESIGIEKVFDVDQDLVSETEWFDDEIIGTKHGDFFVKRSINYSKRAQSITSDDLF